MGIDDGCLVIYNKRVISGNEKVMWMKIHVDHTTQITHSM